MVCVNEMVSVRVMVFMWMIFIVVFFCCDVSVCWLDVLLCSLDGGLFLRCGGFFYCYNLFGLGFMFDKMLM